MGNKYNIDNSMVRVIIIDISNALGSNVYDEAILPINQATEFVKKYIDMSKYRIITVWHIHKSNKIHII